MADTTAEAPTTEPTTKLKKKAKRAKKGRKSASNLPVALMSKPTQFGPH